MMQLVSQNEWWTALNLTLLTAAKFLWLVKGFLYVDRQELVRDLVRG